MSEFNPTRKDAGVTAGETAEGSQAFDIPLQRCPKCGKDIPGFLFRVYELEMPGVGTMQYQGVACPDLDCRTIITVWPLGLKPRSGSGLSHPGTPGWPGPPA